MTRILWDDVPDEVKAELEQRGPCRDGQVAICEAVRGQRWYFTRTRWGWNCQGVDRQADDSVASDLPESVKAAAAADLAARRAKVDAIMAGRRAPPELNEEPLKEKLERLNRREAAMCLAVLLDDQAIVGRPAFVLGTNVGRIRAVGADSVEIELSITFKFFQDLCNLRDQSLRPCPAHVGGEHGWYIFGSNARCTCGVAIPLAACVDPIRKVGQRPCRGSTDGTHHWKRKSMAGTYPELLDCPCGTRRWVQRDGTVTAQIPA